jgi:hypothetical protein
MIKGIQNKTDGFIGQWITVQSLQILYFALIYIHVGKDLLVIFRTNEFYAIIKKIND